MALERGKAEAVIKKIVALRALTIENGATVAEAAAAARMAKRLMYKHDLTEDRIEPVDLDDLEVGFGAARSGSGRMRMAAVVVAAVAVIASAAVLSLDPRNPSAETDAVAALGDAVRLEQAPSSLRLDTVPGAGPADAPIDPAVGAELLARSKVFLNFETPAARRRASELAQFLREADATEIELRQVDIKIARTHVRYFSGDHRSAAHAALALVERAVDDPRKWASVDHTPRDFSSFTPTPPPNTIEIWMGSL